MSARARVAVGIVLAVLGSFVFVRGADAASAARVDDVGWWWRLQADSTLATIPPPPDVEGGQLLVEGTDESDGATAIAAIRATLREGQGNPVLTLTTATETIGETAILLACQAGAGWTGGYAGGWNDKPDPACEESVQGVRSDDGSEWTFALGPLQFDDQINVVLVPGRDETGAGSPMRIVFEAPTADSIQTTDDVGTGGGGSIAGEEFPTPDLDTGSSEGGTVPEVSFDGGGTDFEVPPSTAPPAPAEPTSQAALPDDEQGLTATAPRLQAGTGPTEPISSSEDDSSRAIGLLIVLLGGACFLWAGRQSAPAPARLGRFGRADSDGHEPPRVAADQEATLSGLGRFRRPRVGAPPPLR